MLSDAELAALAGAFRTIVAEQALEQRAAIAAVRQDLDTEVSRAAMYREADAAARERMFKQLAAAVGEAIAPALHRLQQRCGELERRAMPVEAGAVPTEATAQ